MWGSNKTPHCQQFTAWWFWGDTTPQKGRNEAKKLHVSQHLWIKDSSGQYEQWSPNEKTPHAWEIAQRRSAMEQAGSWGSHLSVDNNALYSKQMLPNKQRFEQDYKRNWKDLS